MEYKGYFTKVEYSAEDEVLFGTLLGINDSISFEGESISELKSAFYESVDDYLDMCSRYGKEPEKPYKGSFNVRISPELHKKIAINAIRMGISLNRYIEISLQKSIDGEYDRLQSISEDLGKVASQISDKIYRSTKDIWKSSPYNPHPLFRSENFLKGRAIN